MPMPQASTAPTHANPIPMQRPAAVAAVMAKPSAPFRIRLLPTLIGLFDLTDAPKAALDAVGLAPGRYWLPELGSVPAVPGVNGVRADEGWRVADILAGGYSEVEPGVRAQGGVLLDAWIEVAAPFLPAGVPPGPVLREQPVVWQGGAGTRYLLPWEQMKAVAPGRPAKFSLDRALMGCWIAHLVRSGIAPEAHPSLIEEKRELAGARVERKEAETHLPADMRERRIAIATDYAEHRRDAGAVTRG